MTTSPQGFAIDGYLLVTGAGSGIGLVTCLTFAREGAAGIAFADLDHSAALKGAEESKSVATNPMYRAIALAVDVSVKEDCDKMVEQVVREFGRLDYAVNCAGVFGAVQAPLSLVPASEVQRIMSVNFNGTLFSMQAEIEAMKKQVAMPNPWDERRMPQRGSIVNVASAASQIVAPYGSPYAASKHAVNALTKGAAIDHSASHLRINAVFPAWVDTPMLQTFVSSLPPEMKMRERMEAMIPTKNLALAEEVSDAILWLASRRASYVNGSGIAVDAGGCIWPANHHDVL